MCAGTLICRKSIKSLLIMIEGHGDDLYRYDNIKMNFSSNIYNGTDMSELEAFLSGRLDTIRSYPEPSATSLEQMIAADCGIAPDEVLVTSGAVDAIYLIAQVYRHKDTCRIMRPTFREYEDACRVFGYREQDDGDLCWVCNPNNPTGSVLTASEVMALARCHRLLVVDQSYEDYTMAPLLCPADAVKPGNIILLHSMTKRYAVPGLRLGYVTAPAGIISCLRAQYRPWAINALSLEAGKWLVERGRTAIPDLNSYLAETGRLRRALDAIDPIGTMETGTNFFLCTIQGATARELKEYLAREHGILIRDASNFTGLTPHHFRIATQSPAQNDALVTAIRNFVATIHPN